MHRKTQLKGIVFDLDGTLVDSLATTFHAFNHAFETLGSPKRTPEQIMAHFGLGELQIFEKLVGSEHAAQAYQLAKEYLDQNLSRVPLHAGVGELLEQLRSLDVPLSIFTGRGWETTEIILRHHGLLDRFVTIIAHEHVSAPKPSPEGLQLALTRMNLQPQEVLFIGDSSVDVLAAQGAGSPSVAALWDWIAEKKTLQAYHPDHWAYEPQDVLRILKNEVPL